MVVASPAVDISQAARSSTMMVSEALQTPTATLDIGTSHGFTQDLEMYNIDVNNDDGDDDDDDDDDDQVETVGVDPFVEVRTRNFRSTAWKEYVSILVHGQVAKGKCKLCQYLCMDKLRKENANIVSMR